MLDELTKTFFETFEIKPKYTYLVTDTFYTNNAHTYEATKNDLIDYFEGKNCGRYKVIKVYKTYPHITDRHCLELICILSKYQKDRGSLLEIAEISLDEIKEEVLEMLIYRVDGCKYQVQKLFKGK